MILTNKQAHLLTSILQDTLTKNIVGYLSTSHESRNNLLNEIINQQDNNHTNNLEQSEDTSQITEVFEICNAYESGIGHGIEMDNLPNPFDPNSKLHEAYNLGYQEGEEKRKEDLKDKQEDNISIFKELKSKIHKNNNSNFHFESLPWTIKVWIKNLCDIIDERLDNA